MKLFFYLLLCSKRNLEKFEAAVDIIKIEVNDYIPLVTIFFWESFLYDCVEYYGEITVFMQKIRSIWLHSMVISQASFYLSTVVTLPGSIFAVFSYLYRHTAQISFTNVCHLPILYVQHPSPSLWPPLFLSSLHLPCSLASQAHSFGTIELTVSTAKSDSSQNFETPER